MYKMIRAILKLFVVASEQVDIETEIAPLTKSLKGSFKNPSEFDYKKQLTDRLAEKYS